MFQVLIFTFAVFLTYSWCFGFSLSMKHKREKPRMRLEGSEGKEQVRGREPAGGWGRLRYGPGLHSTHNRRLIPNSEAPSPHNRVAWMSPASGNFSRECALYKEWLERSPGRHVYQGSQLQGPGAPGRPAQSRESPAGSQAAIKAQQAAKGTKQAERVVGAGRGVRAATSPAKSTVAVRALSVASRR